jgi:hypothetical protein
MAATANVSEMAGLLGEQAAKVMAPYRFGPRTDASARGLIDFDNPYGTAWSAHVINEGFSYWKFTAARAQAALVFTNNTLQINDFDADFYGGKLRGRADFAFSRADPTYNFDFSVDSSDVNAMLSAVKDRESTVTGLLSGQATINGRGADLERPAGEGQPFRHERGPLAGAPVRDFLAGSGQHEGDPLPMCTFVIADQSVRTDDMEVAAGAFTANARGQLGFDGKMDFRVQAQFLRAWPGINILTWPICQGVTGVQGRRDRGRPELPSR